MGMLNFLKILFPEKRKWIQTTEQIKVTNWSPSHPIRAFSPTGAIFVLLTCVTIHPCNASGSCTAPYSSRDNLQKLSGAINELAFDLYRSISANSTANFFFSPLSISAVFEMAFYGTRGDTAEELRNVLGYNRAALPSTLVHSAFHDLICNIETADEYSSEGPSLTLANAILVDKSLHLWPSYKNDVEHLYQAHVQDVDFGRYPHAAVQEINNWVTKKTKGRIEKLVDRLNSLTVMVLLNAVHFKGKWQEPFDTSNTKPILFYNYGLMSQAKQVPMMRLSHPFRSLLAEDFQAVELPYQGNSTSMLLMLPRGRNGLHEFERTLTLEKLVRIMDAMQSTRTRVVVPKFKLEYTRELSHDFRALGVDRIFDADFADISGMTPSTHAHVSGVLHKAVIEVNEEGSEAAAATGVVMTSRSMPVFFVADHPFLFAIVDKNSGVILFIGRVTKL